MSYLVPPAELPLAPYMKEHKKGAPTLFTGVTDEERKASIELELVHEANDRKRVAKAAIKDAEERKKIRAAVMTDKIAEAEKEAAKAEADLAAVRHTLGNAPIAVEETWELPE